MHDIGHPATLKTKHFAWALSPEVAVGFRLHRPSGPADLRGFHEIRIKELEEGTRQFSQFLYRQAGHNLWGSLQLLPGDLRCTICRACHHLHKAGRDDRGGESGMAVEFLAKPFQIQALLTAVNQALETDRRRREEQTEVPLQSRIG